MWILGIFRLRLTNALSMILKNKHLNFKLDFAGILLNFYTNYGHFRRYCLFPRQARRQTLGCRSAPAL